METPDLQHAVDKAIREYAMYAQQSKDSEVSDLFAEIRNDLRELRANVDRLEYAVLSLQETYTNDVLPNIKTWNSTSDNQSWLARIVLGFVVAALLALIGLQ